MEAIEQSTNAPLATQELAEAARANGLTLSGDSIARFETYIETLLIWRRRLSLTTAATALAIVRNHITDSLFVAPLVRPDLRVVDLGSGAGFPGLPLAIACPEAHVVLLEARRKKANFLREVVRRARLTNAEVVEERAESLALREAGAYDIVVSRAVWPLAEFLQIGDALLRTDGLAVAMKGPKGIAEAANIDAIRAKPRVIGYVLHGGIQRVLLVYVREGHQAKATEA